MVRGRGRNRAPARMGVRQSVIVVAVAFVVEVYVLKVEDVFLDFSRQLDLDVP